MTRTGRARAVATFIGFVILVLVVWEGAKFLGGNPWRAIGAEPGSPSIWNPPFRWAFASDLNLPHVWSIAYSLGQPFQRSADIKSRRQALLDAGAPLTEETLGTREPRRGMMRL